MKYIEKFRTVGFTGIFENEERYNFTIAGGSEKTLVYRRCEREVLLYDHTVKKVDVMPEAKKQLAVARQDFENILREILKDSGTFTFAKGEHYMIAYRKENTENCRSEKYIFYRQAQNDFYRFVIFLGNKTVLQYLCTVEELLEKFDFTALERGSVSFKTKENNLDAIREGKFPLCLSAKKQDRYLYLAMKWLAGIASQKEADEAAAADGVPRFVPEEKVYGEGVTVSDVKQQHPTFFSRRERYSCTVTIDLRRWSALWRPGEQLLRVEHSLSGEKIKISDEVYESLKKQAVKKYSV